MSAQRIAGLGVALTLVLAAISNALSLSVIGLGSYLDDGAGGGSDGGWEPGDFEALSRLRDSIRRRAVDRRVSGSDWTQYTPYPPGMPSLAAVGIGTAEEHGYIGLADERFLVFYKPAAREGTARAVLGQLQRSADRVGEVLGDLPTQSREQGRKIVVYLPATDEEFGELGRAWGVQARRSAGFCAVVWDAFLQPYLAGIFLEPSAFESADFLPILVTHELTHYAFEMSRGVRMRVATASWFTEGLAEYVAQHLNRLREIPPNLDPSQSLAKRSPPDGNWRWSSDDYWMGLSALLVVETRRGQPALRQAIGLSRQLSTHEAFERSGVALEDLEREWKEALPGMRNLGGIRSTSRVADGSEARA